MNVKRQLTTCIYCGCGCGLYLIPDGDKLVGSYPSKNNVTSKSALCVKGWNAHEYTSRADRLTTPLIKKDGQFRKASWQEAISLIAKKLKGYKESDGSDSLGFLSSAKTPTKSSAPNKLGSTQMGDQ